MSGHRDDALVWYAAYGSNMAAQRLACYLAGGLPVGGRLTHSGTRDATPARADRPVTLPLQLRFADRSRVWGGGKAFVDPSRPGRTLARAWLITRGQFADLSAQESSRAADDDALERLLGSPAAQPRSVVLGPGPYDRLLDCGAFEGVPTVTFTHPGRPAPRAPTPPYLRMLAAGLAQAHGLSTDRAAAYLATADGVERSPGQITALLVASGAPPDEQPDGAAPAEVLDPLDGQQFVPGAVDPARERRR